jgi:hypothetical protein
MPPLIGSPRQGTVIWMNPEERIARLTRRLGLTDEPQDWGIVNADSERLEEFVEFLETGHHDSTEAYLLVELILASANERLLQDRQADIEGIVDAMALYPPASAIHRPYWASLTDDAEFPLGSWLRARDESRSP